MKPVRITEVSTMGLCERKWWYRYHEGTEDEGSAAMHKGTLIHAMSAAWWKHGQPNTLVGLSMDSIVAEINPAHRAEVEDLSERDKDDAMWAFDRYCQVYGGRNDFELVASEVEMEAEIDGLLLQGKADLIVRHVESGKLYLGETKTMKDWRRLDILQVDPQVTHYNMLALSSGYAIHGVLYDAIKTYRWKRDEHPPEDSVKRLFLDRTSVQMLASLDDLHAFDDRRAQITDGCMPLRNVTAFGSCSFCSFRPQCWEAMAFPETEITVEGA